MKPILMMLVGLPASGKSSLAQTLAKEHNAIIHASDALREELYKNENYQGKNDEIFSVLHKKVKNDLINGSSVIYDATNISYKKRMAFLTQLKNIECEKICIVVATTYEDCLKHNRERERQVPEDVIKRMYMNWNTPYFYEGWDEIQVVYVSPKNKSWVEFFLEYENFNQDNSHHDLSLGEHLNKTGKYIGDYFKSNFDLSQDENHTRLKDCVYSGLMHDCGKPFTKTFLNIKGEATKDAHYYQHQCVGAYDSLFYDFEDGSLDISILIQWHMQPYS